MNKPQTKEDWLTFDQILPKLPPPMYLEDINEREQECPEVGTPGHVCTTTLSANCCGTEHLHIVYRAGVIYMFCGECMQHVTSVAVADKMGSLRPA